MKLINFFNKLSPLVKTAIIAGIIGILIIAISSIFIIQGLEKKYNSSSDSNTSLLISPTPLIGANNPTATPDPYEGWKEYKDEELGIKFYIPKTYTVSQSSHQINCDDAKETIKDIQCITNYKVTYTQISDKTNSLNFEIPRHGLGGDCVNPDEQRTTVTTTYLSQNYSLRICVISNNIYVTDPFYGDILDNSKTNSRYTKLLLRISTLGKENLDTLLKILGSSKVL